MNDKRRLAGRRVSSRSLSSLCGPADDAASITISHDLYNRDAGYRERITGCVVAEAMCHEFVQVHFICTGACCLEVDPEVTAAYLLSTVERWMA